jgi:hypothetical protein
VALDVERELQRLRGPGAGVGCRGGTHQGMLRSLVNGEPSGGFSLRRPGSEEPHRRERKLINLYLNMCSISIAINSGI